MHLASGYESAKYLANFAASGKRRQEKLDLFHAGRDNGLQIDGGKHRDRRHLRSGCAFGNGFLVTCAKQLPFGRLAGG
jgi:hypothetical protein